MSKREADEAWAFHRALAGETKPYYEASRVDASTWRVTRFHEEPSLPKGDPRTFDEALLRDMPADTTEEQAIQVAVERGSWA